MYIAKIVAAVLLSLVAASVSATPTLTTTALANTFIAVPGTPVAHIVSYKYLNTTTAAFKQEALTRFRSLNNVVRFADGKPVTQSFVESVPPLTENKNPLIGFQKGYTDAYVITFASYQDRLTYINHPTQQDFANWLIPELEDLYVYGGEVSAPFVKGKAVNPAVF